MSFAISIPVALAIALGVCLPLFLWIVTRMPFAADRQALQFLVAFVCVLLIWFICIGWLTPGHLEAVDVALGLMALASAGLFYLEIWALLSRGYTLGVLLTLLRAGHPMSENDITAAYRGGDGLSWIMSHRLGGLAAARLVTVSGDTVRLTPWWGRTVARSYSAAIMLLGLGRTG